MKNQILIALIVIIITIIIVAITTTVEYINTENTENTEIENFDAKVKEPNLNKDKCGLICTSIIGCKGFAYDDTNDVCYLSKDPILGKPFGDLYSDEYQPYFYRCNKTQAQLEDMDINSPETLKRNTLYFCSDSEEGKYDLTIISPKVKRTIGDFDELDKIEIPDYELIDNFQWPTSKYDKVLGEKKDFSTFELQNDEFLGKYVFPQKCTQNIGLQDCLRICDLDKECIGTEWNPYYLKPTAQDTYEIYKNICCPKTKIRDIIPRRSDFENGRFYLKKHITDFKPENIYIVSKN